jgi:hypothetical protein
VLLEFNKYERIKENDMENAEQHESQEDATIEQSTSNDNSDLVEQMAALKATNDRLLAQSKENANKYRALRDKADAEERLELEKSENWKQLLDKEKNENHELREKHNALKKAALKKDLDFTVANMIDAPLSTGVEIDDVIEQVLKTGMVEVADDDSSFLNVKEAFDQVKNTKMFLFNPKKAPMTNTVPNAHAPAEKKITNEELLKAAILQVAKK